ncbi:MAG: ROK family protein [Thermomicrobiales bacterium]
MNARAIGIDIGGTKIAAGLVDLATGEVEFPSTVCTAVDGGGDAVLDQCRMLVNAIDTHESGSRAHIGITVPELVGLDGTVQSASLFDWRTTDVRAAFPGRTVTVVSDVRAAALAESRFGAGVGATSMLYVSVGTGISSTLVIGGEPWAGARGNALVIASGHLAAIDERNGAVVHSTLEEWASGAALVTRFEAAGGVPGHSTAEILALADAGDRIAAKVVHAAAEALGSAIGQAVNLLDPEIVVIGGGLGLAARTTGWWDRIVAATRRAIWSAQTRDLPIVPAGLGTLSGVVGAALAASMASGSPVPCRSG